MSVALFSGGPVVAEDLDSAKPGYIWTNALPDERRRLAAIEEAYDEATKTYLQQLGATAGSRVLIVGAGGGSFAPWLSDVVGQAGLVVLTDLDTRFLRPIGESGRNVQVLEHDLVTDELPRDSFDIVHARLVLIHLPEREAIMRKLVAALKPGGWLLVEDYDWGSYGPAFPCPPEDKAIAAVAEFLAATTGFEPYLGRRLPTMLRSHGLVDVDAVGRVITLRGAGSSLEGIYRDTLERLAPRLVAKGLLHGDEAAAVFERMADPAYDMISQTMMSVWGRRPG
jgi:SAM-dependent methyltransferase